MLPTATSGFGRSGACSQKDTPLNCARALNIAERLFFQTRLDKRTDEMHAMLRFTVILLTTSHVTAYAFGLGFGATPKLVPQLRSTPVKLYQRKTPPFEPQPTLARSEAAGERTKRSSFKLPTHLALPALSYTGLAAVTAGSIKIVGAGASWLSFGILGCVAFPAAFVATMSAGGGEKIAKSMGGKLADRTLIALTNEAADAVGVPRPQAVYEISAHEPNAFAASNLFSKSQTVAVTSGLRSILNTNELKAVLAHEMGHLKHADVVRNMHVAIAVAGMGGVYDAGRMILDSSSKKRRSSSSKDDDKDSGAPVGLMLMGAGLAAQGIAQGVRLAASRNAEIRADRAAAEAFGSDAMINALRKIDQAAGRRPADLRESKAGRAFAFAMISDGESQPAASSAAATSKKRDGSGLWRKLVNALRTHPPTDERIAALEKATVDGLVPASRSSSSWF